MNYDERLDELFIDIPEPPPDIGNSLGAIQTGKYLHIGGTLPFSEGRIQYPGRVGVDLRLDNAKLAARSAAVMTLAYAKRELGGSINKIRRVVRVDGFVACGADYKDHLKVLDGASELFAQVFGPNGKHIRTAVGAPSLPHNACVELSVVFEVK